MTTVALLVGCVMGYIWGRNDERTKRLEDEAIARLDRIAELRREEAADKAIDHLRKIT